jgi:hypothetical protein
MNLHETVMGQRLILGTLPDIAHQLQRIADSLEKLTESKSVSANIGESLHMMTSFPMVDTFTSTSETKEPNLRGEGTAQAVLDYVDKKGAVTHKELHEFYKSLNGSNTFSWCLRNLRIPYKNRKTQRYLAKEGLAGSNAKYIVKLANPSNWVVKEY